MAVPVFTLRDSAGGRRQLTYSEVIHLVSKQTVDNLVADVMRCGRIDEACKSCEAGRHGQLIVTLKEQMH